MAGRAQSMESGASRTSGANFAASWSHLIRQGSIPLSGAAFDRSDGEINTPNDRASFSVGFDTDAFGINFNGQYIGASYLDDQYRARFLLADGSLPDKQYFRVDSAFYADMQLRFNVDKGFEFFAGINNLLDTQPAPVITGLTGSVTAAHDTPPRAINSASDDITLA